MSRPVELRIIALTPPPGSSTVQGEQKSAEPSCRPTPPPHCILPVYSPDAFYYLVSQVCHSHLTLTQFTITVAADGCTLGQSQSFSDQRLLDEAITTLPLGTPFCVTDCAAGFSKHRSVLDEVNVNISFTVHEADSIAISHSAASSGTVVIVPITAPRLARVDDSSVQLNTLFRLSPSLAVPLSTCHCLSEAWKAETIRRTKPNESGKGWATVMFELDRVSHSDDQRRLDFHCSWPMYSTTTDGECCGLQCGQPLGRIS